MGYTLSEFHSLVSTSLKRGTSLDSVIPGYVKLAGLWLERNYTFKYMDVYRLLQLASGDRTIQLPSNKRVKSVDFIRLIDDEGLYTRLKRGDAQDFLMTSDAAPTGYWIVGTSTIVFNNTPDEDLSGEAIFSEYTDWPTASDETHPLLDLGADVLLYQSLIHMAAYLRDAEMVAAYKALRDEGLNTLIRADDEFTYDGQSISMGYEPFHTQ